ncbi:MAG: caspase family protein, partial [Chloroflexi bacterium]|nr:caspase family protein [Chloroflexota bacterium]
MNFERGLVNLDRILKQAKIALDSDVYLDFLGWKGQLLESVEDERRFAVLSPQGQERRERVLRELERLALRYANNSFIDLCADKPIAGASDLTPLLDTHSDKSAAPGSHNRSDSSSNDAKLVPQKPNLTPLELADASRRHTLTLFIGADLPCEVTGLTSRVDLARELARRKELDESLSLAEVAQRVSQAGNRWEFTDFIRNALDTAGKSPQPFHQRIVALVKEYQIKTIITTAYDNLLELAFQQAGVGINRVVRGGDVSFINPDRPTLIRLYGDAQQPDSLIVTDRDHSDLLRDRGKEALVDEVRQAFRRNTVLFLGYNLSDPDFRFLFDQIAESRFARTAYAVWPGLPEADVRMWRDRGIVILDVDPLSCLESTQIKPDPQASNYPTASDLREFLEQDYQLFEDALNDVHVSIAGGSPLVRYSATSNWNWLISRSINIPEDIQVVFGEVVEIRERGRGGIAKLTEEQLLSAKQGISRILEFLHEQFPTAGVKPAFSCVEIAVRTNRSPKLPPSTTKGADMDYERGLNTLKGLAEGADWYQDFTVHEAPLRENLRDERRYGPSEQTRRDRTRIIDQLNALALKHLGISFNDLCLGMQPPPKPSTATKGDGEPTQPEIYGTGNRWAILVGVNEYEDQSNYGQLQVCVKDVHAIREQLVAGGFDPARIRLLTDDMPDELPTRDNILTALKAIADATEPDDLLLFYYSGHGDEVDGESYLVTRNGRRLVLSDTAVRVSRVKEIVEEAPARAKVIVLDACHSGADIGGKGPKAMTEEFIRRVFEEAEGLVILASCKQGQLSYEWQENERSVFTHYLLEALEGQA